MINKNKLSNSVTRLSFGIVLVAVIAISVCIPLSANADSLYRELQLGMSGSDVSSLQTFLMKDKSLYPQGQVTGYFGSLTKKAVSTFQSRNGIKAIGRVGPATLKAINAQINNVSSVDLNTSSTVDKKLVINTTNVATNVKVNEVKVNEPSTVNTNTNINSKTKSDTTFTVALVPLLSGGVARASASVPISYLQITNTGKENASLKGFWVKQNGSASVQSVVNFTTIDDKGSSQGSSGGTEGATLFKDGLAFAPTDAMFAPGQMRLFTIRVVLSKNISSNIGKNLKIDVASIETSARVEGSFPIKGTTWTIYE